MHTWTDAQSDFLRTCGLDPSALSPEPFRRLYDALLEANRQFNLTRITEDEDYWTLHVLDSLSVGRVLPELLTGSVHVADVGPGGGFPLLALAVANPAGAFLGIESSARKADFLTTQAHRLGLGNVRILPRQAREAVHLEGLAGSFHAVVLRAVGPAGKLLRDVRNLLAEMPEASIAFYKTPAAVDDERPLAQREAGKYHLRLETPEPFSLPDGSERQFLLLRR